MAKESAGIVLYRYSKNTVEVLLVHPGGPFWKNKDAGAWSIPKGELEEDESPFLTAIRELKEELNVSIKKEDYQWIALTPVKQKSGKTVHAWAVEMDIDADEVKSNLFEMEWPPKSGKKASFPEIDKAGWFDVKTAKEKIIEAQYPLMIELMKVLAPAK
jgi:predicted NUDIX family NTP pyrophosphohydrolase